MTDQPTDQEGDGKTVPYARFKQVNDRYKAALAELEDARKTKGGDGQPEGGDGDTDYKALYEEAKRETDGLKLARLRDKIALEAGVPLDLASKIAGDTEDTMRADAEAMARYVGLNSRPVAPNIDATTPDATSPAKITLDAINDPAFYAKNRDRIFEAVTTGRVK